MDNLGIFNLLTYFFCYNCTRNNTTKGNRIMKKTLTYLSIALALAGCTSKEDYVLFNQTHITSPDANRTVTRIKNNNYEYRIQPHDRISITMYNHPELGTSTIQSQREDKRGVLVDSKGYVRLPLIKNIHIAGLTQAAAQKKIEHAFKPYLEDAEVYLEVLNKRAYIVGEVNKPGEVPLFNERLTLLQMLATAGDLKDGANRKSIVILHKRGNKVYTRTVDLTGPDSLKLANLTIHPNDVVYVTPKNMKVFNVGVNEASPVVGLVGKVTGPAASVKYLLDK